jgi:hypothetical protein
MISSVFQAALVAPFPPRMLTSFMTAGDPDGHGGDDPLNPSNSHRTRTAQRRYAPLVVWLSLLRLRRSVPGQRGSNLGAWPPSRITWI